MARAGLLSTARARIWLAAGALVAGCSGAQADPGSPQPPVADPEHARENPAAKGSGARAAADPSSEYDGTLARPLVDRVIAAGPGYFLSEVPLDPVLDAGHRFLGFRIVSIFGNRPRVLAYGVLPGDMLVAINGQRIITPGDLMVAFERVKSAPQLAISVVRDGRPVELSFPIVDARPEGAPFP